MTNALRLDNVADLALTIAADSFGFPSGVSNGAMCLGGGLLAVTMPFGAALRVPLLDAQRKSQMDGEVPESPPAYPENRGSRAKDSCLL